MWEMYFVNRLIALKVAFAAAWMITWALSFIFLLSFAVHYPRDKEPSEKFLYFFKITAPILIACCVCWILIPGTKDFAHMYGWEAMNSDCPNEILDSARERILGCDG